MTGYIDYYSLLQVSRDADEEEIRRSFRKLAHIYHPDKNRNSSESNNVFNSLLQAYETLISQEKRAVYNSYLRNSSIVDSVETNYTSNSPQKTSVASDGLSSQLNFILWEIEDILSQTKPALLKSLVSGYTIEKWLSRILSFIDQWLLTPAGFGDYFFTARNIQTHTTYNPYEDRLFGDHLPYTDTLDYFYQIRRRMDKFLADFHNLQLAVRVPGFQVSFRDAIFEAVNLSFHYLSSIQQVLSGKKSEIHTYRFFNPVFGSKKHSLSE